VKTAARVLIAASMIGAAAAGYFGYRALGPESTVSGPIAAVAERPSAPPPVARASEPVRPPIPEVLPDIAMDDRDGRRRKLAEWSGRPLLINFWATWCAPCRREIPLLKQLRAERREQNLEVIGIAVDFRDEVLRYADQIGLDYPLLIGEDEGLAAAGAFGMDLVLPFSVFADRQGRIVTLKVGELHAAEAAFILDRIREVDTGRMELAAARKSIADELKELAVTRAKEAKLDLISAEAGRN
jgi:thiol-disulfide isomerase/thioredoxin